MFRPPDIVEAILQFIPRVLIRTILRIAAIAPAALKTSVFERVCRKCAGRGFADLRTLVRTNMGIAGIRCWLPVFKTRYVFGRPDTDLSERAALALAKSLSSDCAHFLDVGAHDGLFTFHASRTARGALNVHCFEPDSDIYLRLVNNLRLNGICARANRTAVCDAKGTTSFYKNLSDDSSGSLRADFSEKHMVEIDVVETVTLADYFRENEIRKALVKIDVEGAGWEAWQGTKGAADEISYLIIEMIAQEHDRKLLDQIISDTGFRAYYIKDFVLEEIRDSTEYLYAPPFWNWLFCRLNPGTLEMRLAGTKFQVSPREDRVF